MSERIITVVPAYNEEESIIDTLQSLDAQKKPLEGIIVVDNASTDDTPNIVEDYQRHSLRPVHLLHEPKKGTGFASRTGFDYAINGLDADIVSRTDADTVPVASWTDAMADRFGSNAGTQLISGPTYAKRDKFYQTGDNLIVPLLRPLSGIALRRLHSYKYPAGHNMAIRPAAYERVGGFTASTIDSVDEDIELARAIEEEFGHAAIEFVRGMSVNSSVRRVRGLGDGIRGYINMGQYYKQSGPEENASRRFAMTGGQIDIR